jgi:hypothetical protein
VNPSNVRVEIPLLKDSRSGDRPVIGRRRRRNNNNFSYILDGTRK